MNERKFKEITATFHVEGKHYEYYFVIERLHSGANKYGDESCHTLDIYKEGTWVGDYLYDTRYDCIGTDKEEWVNSWKEFIQNNWENTPKVTLVTYKERKVDWE